MANLTATAAVLYEIKKPLVIEEVELLDPTMLLQQSACWCRLAR